MHSHEQEPPDVSKGYEVRDVESKQMAYGAVGFFALAGLSAVIIYLFLWLAPAKYFPGARVGPPKEPVADLKLPADPNPVLQNNITNRTDIWNLRAKEAATMSSYGWVDKSKGVTHIPIDQALDDMFAKGPENAGSDVAPPTGATQLGHEMTLPSGGPTPATGVPSAAGGEGAQPNPTPTNRPPADRVSSSASPTSQAPKPKPKVPMPAPMQGHLPSPSSGGGASR